MSVSKCCPPYLFHWGLVPVGSTVGTGERGRRCWNSGSDTVLTSTADTDRAAKILQPSRIPEEWTPPLCLCCSPPPPPLVPLQHSSLYFPPRPGWDTKKSSTVHTCCNTLPQTRDKGRGGWENESWVSDGNLTTHAGAREESTSLNDPWM